MSNYTKSYEFSTIKIPISIEQRENLSIKITNKIINNHSCRIANEKHIVNLFLQEIANSKDSAKNYISKGLIAFNIDEVQGLLRKAIDYKHLIDTGYMDTNIKFKKNSILIINEFDPNTILHVYLKKEPDSYSDWKIYFIKND